VISLERAVAHSRAQDVVDAIAAMPNDNGPNNRAINPVPMLTVTIKKP